MLTYLVDPGDDAGGAPSLPPHWQLLAALIQQLELDELSINLKGLTKV